MEHLIRGGEDFQLLYNCSFYDANELPIERRRNILFGLGVTAVATLEMILYVPCMISIWGRRNHSCFKFMFAMGVLDMLMLVYFGPLTGAFDIAGNVFCAAPTINYIIASLGCGISIAETFMELLLAINRCFYFALPNLALKLFPDNKHWVWSWCLPPIIYGVLYGLFGKLAFFSGLISFWAWSPHIGYHDEMLPLYINTPEMKWWTVHHAVLFGLLPIVYSIFAFFVWKTSKIIKLDPNLRSSSTKPIFKQIALITIINCLSAFLTILFEYATTQELLNSDFLFDVFIWVQMQMNGIPPVIYLFLNKMIKRDVEKMMKPWLKLIRKYTGLKKGKNLQSQKKTKNLTVTIVSTIA